MKVLWFTAAWCGPCKKMKPLVEKIQQEFPHLQVEVIDIDTPEGQNKAAAHNVTGVPTFIREDGQGRLIGAHPKGKVLKDLGIS